MARHHWRLFGALLLVLTFVGCGAASPGPGSPSPATTPPLATAAPSRAASFEAFRDAYCSTWSSMFDAVGNPDTGSGSELSLALAAAVKAGDVAEVNRLAGRIHDELEIGRRHAAVGAGWVPAQALMAEMDRLLAAFEASVEAERAAVAGGVSDVAALSQRAFEQAGGLDAWQRLNTAAGPVMSARPAGPSYQCPGIPVSV